LGSIYGKSAVRMKLKKKAKRDDMYTLNQPIKKVRIVRIVINNEGSIIIIV
jgi:hypothetical protein